MSKIQPARAFSSRKFSGFRGFGHTEVLSGISPSVVRNFRPHKDGTLEVRSGFSASLSFSAPLRGYWEGKVNDAARKFAVAGNTVYSLSGTLETKVSIGTLKTSSGSVSFALLQGVLYLLDGTDIYYMKESSGVFAVHSPYVPLYGEKWHPSNYGDIKEQLNLLTQRLRVRYLDSNGTTTFVLPYYPSSIDYVLINGNSTQNFTWSGRDVVVPDATLSVTVEVGFVINLELEQRVPVISSPKAFVFGSGTEERMAVYGNSSDYYLHCTTPVTTGMLVECQKNYPWAGALYFTAFGAIPVGDTTHPVTSVCSCKGGLLAFTSDRTSFFGYDSEHPFPSLTTVISGTGCTSAGAACLCGDTPAAIDDGGVTLFRSDRTHPEIIDPVRISDAVSDFFAPEFCQKAILFWDGRHEELWVGNPENRDGLFLIWNRALDTWYAFDGIGAGALFTVSLEKGKQTGMLQAAKLCLFDDNLHTDNGNDITAVYRTSFFDCSHAETARRSVRSSLCATPDGNRISLTLETERSRKTFVFPENSSEVPSHFDCRFASGRHRFLRCTITSSGSGDAKFYALAVYEKL